MNRVNQILLFLHFVGMALGFSVSFANMVMSSLIAKALPAERATLGRFPPVMSKLGRSGLALLWITGGILVYTRWGGFGNLPWQFHIKVAAVILLTFTTVYIHRLEALIQQGQMWAAARIGTLGKMATVLALAAVVFAVLTFD